MPSRLLLAALLATALGALHQNLVGTGSPRVVEELGGADLYSLVPVAYLVATVVGALAALALGRHRSSGELLVIGLAAFAAGVSAAAAAGAMWQLVVARGVAGLGAGVVFVVAASVARSDAGRQALVMAAFAGGFAIAPLAGDVTTDLAGWRATFLLAVPPAILALVLALLSAPSRAPMAPAPRHEPGLDRRPPTWERFVAMLAGALAAGAVFVAFIFLPAAGSIMAAGGDGVPILAIPIALGAVVGALVARRLPPVVGSRTDLLVGLVLLGGSLLARAALPSAGAGAGGWLIAGAAGLGAGLALTGASRLTASASVSGAAAVAARQLGGLAGLGIGAAVLFGGLLDRLVASLRPIIDAVVVEVPARYQLLARAAADEALRTLGDELSAANVGGGGEGGAPRTFADIVIARIPGEFQALAVPHVDALNAAFADALRAALSAAFAAGALLAALAFVVGIVAAWLDARFADRGELPPSE